MKLEVLYLIAHFYPQTVFSVVSHNELININLSFQNNLLTKIAPKQFMKFLAYDRLGSFTIIKNEIKFVPGIIRPDLYCPIPITPPIFHIAALLHINEICTHKDAILYAMKFREAFYEYDLWQDQQCESELTLKSVLTYRNIVRSVNLRAKRRARTSISNQFIIKQFFAFLSSRGYYDWHLIRKEN